MHIPFKNTGNAILLLSLFLLAACTTSPLSIQLHPQLTDKESRAQLEGQIEWQINSEDLRIAHHLIEITDGEKAALLVNESQSSRLIIENALQQQWRQSGLNFKTDSVNKITIGLLRLLAEVEQNSLTHNTSSQIVLKVELSNEKRVFSKFFRSRFTKEGPFTADIKKVAAQLNTQLSQLLNEIVQDQEVNAKLLQL